jgi:DNA-binding transcriptional ArsR family regulator
MSQIRFGVADVAEVRFVVSPLWETVRSLYAVDDPGRHAVHRPWVRRVRSLATRPEVAALRGYVRPHGWTPDFLTPPPLCPPAAVAGVARFAGFATFADELAALRATPIDMVRADIAATRARLPLSDVARAALDDPRPGLAALADAVEAWHDLAIAAYWPRIRALLEADIAYRGRQLAYGGARLLFDTLHPSLRWAGDHIVADDPWQVDVDLRGRGLPLVPSVFVDRRVLWTIRSSSRPLGAYPARGTATLWPATAPVEDGLAAVLGSSRARLLRLLQAPLTTAELARLLGVSAPAVSQHLQALYRAGLVARSRHGRRVLYFLTPTGDALMTGR